MACGRACVKLQPLPRGRVSNGNSDKTETVLTLSQNVCLGKTKRRGVVRMLKEHPELLPEATLGYYPVRAFDRRESEFL